MRRPAFAPRPGYATATYNAAAQLAYRLARRAVTDFEDTDPVAGTAKVQVNIDIRVTFGFVDSVAEDEGHRES